MWQRHKVARRALQALAGFSAKRNRPLPPKQAQIPLSHWAQSDKGICDGEYEF